MPDKDYWVKRQESLQLSLMDKAEDYSTELEAGYKEAITELEKQISVWYQRFADNNEVDMVTAQRILNNKELAELKWDIDTYIKRGKESSLDGKWMKELENASARVHISRLEALKLQTRQQIEQLYADREDRTTQLIGDTYTDSLYKNGYESYCRTGVKTTFDKIDKRKLSQLISTPWTTDGINFSDRIWNNKQQLIKVLNNEFTKAMVTGEKPTKLIEDISRRLGSDMKATKRLVMTESAYFATKGQEDCYKELGVEEYEIIGTLDSATCDECGDYDGKHFKRTDMQAGVTAPPFHPNCRCTTVPYFNDEFTEGEQRAARGEDGKTTYVDSMTYQEWKAEYVDNATKSDIINYARASDIFLYDEDDIPISVEIKPDDIINELEGSDVGKEIVNYLESNKVYPQLIYEPQYHSNRGEQCGDVIKIYMGNISSPRVAAQTIIHEVTHHKYNIGQCQWAEAVCMAKEKMHIVGRNKLTSEELRYIVKLAKDNYPEYKWKKGGYRYGKKI